QHTLLIPYFFSAPAPSELYTLSLHDALPIYGCYEALVALNGAEIVETQHTGQSSNTLQSRAVAPSSSATGVQPPAVPPAVPPGVVAVTPTPESQTIDLRGLTAPEPMSQLSRVASTSPVGVSVTVLADDPAFLTDV